MSTPAAARELRSLDPEDWEATRRLGHRMIDDMLDWIRAAGDRPAWRAPDAAAVAALRRPLPRQGEGGEAAYRAFREQVLPFALGNLHPRFWGWVMGPGTAGGMLADLLASGLNANVFSGDQGAAYVELQVLDWSKAMLGLDAAMSGVLVSSGSMANLVALAAAREAACPETTERGVMAFAGTPVIYASTETHNSVDKAIRLLGMGRDGLRHVPVTADFRIDLAELERAIASDRAEGKRPVAIVGNLGGVKTGASDDLAALAVIARREGVWFHVDGAFGAAAALSPALRPVTRGMELADSVTFDFHKWLAVPYDAACVLVRSAEDHRRPFASPISYLSRMARGPGAGPCAFSDLGIDLSRGFRALRIWMTLLEHGADALGAQVEKNVTQAARLAALITAAAELELLAPAPLNVVCFRYRGGVAAERLDDVNRELLMRLQEKGLAVPSHTVIDGAFALRVAIVNHRTTLADIDGFVEDVLRLGREVAAQLGRDA